MQSIFTHEDWASCPCCSCSIGILDVAPKGGVFARTGYDALNSHVTGAPGSTSRYRTVASRGWGALDTPDDGPVYNDLQCSFARAFYNADHPIEYYGFMLSQLWGGPLSPIPWGANDRETQFGPTPYSESVACADGHLEFYPAVLEAALIRAIELDGENNPTGPRGVTHLVNEILEADEFAELQEFVRELDFPLEYFCGWLGAENEGVTGCNYLGVRHDTAWSGSSTFLVYELAKYRRRFPVPPSGSVRFEWDIYFIPSSTGVPVLFDTIKWQWDGVVPVDYDIADPDTWPATPWFEMPEFHTARGYGEFRINQSDWRVFCDSDAAPTAPGAITARNV